MCVSEACWFVCFSSDVRHSVLLNLILHGAFTANNADLPLAATFMDPFEWKSNIDFLCFSNRKRTLTLPATLNPFRYIPMWIMYEVMPALTNSHLVAGSESTYVEMDVRHERVCSCADSRHEPFIRM